MSNTFIPTWKCLFWDENDKYTEEIVAAATIHEASAKYNLMDGHGSVMPTKESCDFFDANPGEKEKAYAPLPPYPEYNGDVDLLRSFPTRKYVDLGHNLVRPPDLTWRDASAISRLILHLIDSK